MVLAITSHLPHLIAYTIVGTAEEFSTVSRSEVLKFSAGGFRDFTRIAASDPTMWRDVFLHNKDAVLEMLAQFSEDLAKLTRAMRRGDGDALFEHFTRTRAIRRGIVQIGQDSAAPDFGRAHPAKVPIAPLPRPYAADGLDRRIPECAGSALEVDSLPSDMQTKFLRFVELIETIGLAGMREPHVKHLEGKLWEMRMTGATAFREQSTLPHVIAALLCCEPSLKKTQRTPQVELEIARQPCKGDHMNLNSRFGMGKEPDVGP